MHMKIISSLCLVFIVIQMAQGAVVFDSNEKEDLEVRANRLLDLLSNRDEEIETEKRGTCCKWYNTKCCCKMNGKQ